MIPVHISYTSVLQFLTVVKHMNMNQAASELFISQPALSLSIAKLEKSLGITLFYRDKKKLILSKDAERLMPFFEDLRRSHDALLKEAEAIRETQSGTITISFSGSPYFFSTLMFSNSITQYNNGNISLYIMNSNMALNMLLSGQIDFAISVIPIYHPLVSSITLLEEPIGVALPFCHEAAKEKVISLEQLSGLKLHGLEKKNNFRQLCDEIASAHNVSLHYETEDGYSAYLEHMESGGPDCAFMTTARNYEQNFRPLGGYVFKDISGDVFRRETKIYFIEQDKKHYLHEDLIRMLQSNMSMYSEMTTQFSRLVSENLNKG